MKLPSIDISILPDLDKLTGVFGSVADPLQAAQSDDTIIIVMVFIYDVLYVYW
jgi:hypothetical protein